MNWVSLMRGKRNVLWDTLSIIAGCALIALGFRLFMNANGIIAGGLLGLSTVLERRFGWEAAWVQWGINVPLLVLGFLVLGKTTGARSALGSLLLPLFMLLTRSLQPITHTPLLASLFGGIVYGAGLGLVLSGSGSVGGYSLLSRLLTRRSPRSVSAVIFALDSLTILGGGWLFGAERAMYGLIAAFVMRRAVDTVLLGFSHAKLVLVISSAHEAIRQTVLAELKRGLTVLPGTGGYTGESRPVLLIVLSQAEVPQLRSLVRTHDPSAFVVVADATEVLGEGFHRET
jgi:uncharacterized membrane-anchored protein YitT (DUF2179 family)